MAQKNENFAVKISVCENMADDKIVILCSPKMKETVENMLLMIEDTIEDFGENFPDLNSEEEDDSN